MIRGLNNLFFMAIKPNGSIRPRMYDLPKLHKQNIPLRPILSMIKSPKHKLAKLLNFLLEPVLVYYSQFVVKDSFEVIKKIRYAKSTNTVLTSFDVKQLFTSVPLEESIKISVDKLYEIRKLNLEKNNLIKLMKIAMSDVQFSFNNTIYSQIDGVAMGSP